MMGIEGPKCRVSKTAICFIGGCLLMGSHSSYGGLFSTSEQEARSHFSKLEFPEAANLFEDPYRKGVAQYRAGNYQAAAESFTEVNREDVLEDARYNLGNARFRLGDFEGAIEAYEYVLSENPDATDARHNLAIARAMLMQAIEQQKEQERKRKEEEQQQEQEEQQQEQEEQQQQQKQEQQQQEQEQQQQEQEEQQQ